MTRVLLVGIGGFVGSILRYWMSGFVQAAAAPTSFPVGTFAVNVLGSLLIGVLSGVADARGVLGPDARALLVVGLLGGFTTFSAFANETFDALRGGAVIVGVANVVLSVGACLFAVWMGRGIAAAVS